VTLSGEADDDSREKAARILLTVPGIASVTQRIRSDGARRIERGVIPDRAILASGSTAVHSCPMLAPLAARDGLCSGAPASRVRRRASRAAAIIRWTCARGLRSSEFLAGVQAHSGTAKAGAGMCWAGSAQSLLKRRRIRPFVLSVRAAGARGRDECPQPLSASSG